MPKESEKVELAKRKNLRLPGVDYTNEGFYFVTICVDERRCILGEIQEKSPQAVFTTSSTGQIVQNVIDALPYYLPIRSSCYQIMPNHFHIILEITDHPTVGAGFSRPQITLQEPKCYQNGNRRCSLGEIIQYFKYETTRFYNDQIDCGRQKGAPTGEGNAFCQLWQRGYYDHIIRDEKEFNHLDFYIRDNPNNWNEKEANNPELM